MRRKWSSASLGEDAAAAREVGEWLSADHFLHCKWARGRSVSLDDGLDERGARLGAKSQSFHVLLHGWISLHTNNKKRY